MKIIRYQLCTEINHGTEDEPDIEQVFSSVGLGWSPENEELAKKEAYNGEYSIHELPDDRPVETIRAEKLDQINAACSAAIAAGVDVETSAGTEHFGLEETDQINLSTALDAVKGGGTGYPYHADGKLCRMFTAAEITAIAQASVRHKLTQTTYCNHLRAWVKRCETADEITAIVYGDALPEDLQTNMEAVLAAAQGDNNG